MKNIVIIGASRGIGFELVQILSKENNVLAFSRNIEKLKTIEQKQLKVESIDISTSEFETILADKIKKHFSHVDILINNAGTLVNKPVLEISQQDMMKTFQTNVFGIIKVCQTLIPFMGKGTHIVNIGSMGGFQGSAKFSGLSIYSASKAAIANFSECLAEELKDQNIKVNCLALGAVQTEMLNEAFPGYQAPLSAKEMANFISDFSLNAHHYINGKVIPVSISTP